MAFYSCLLRSFERNDIFLSFCDNFEISRSEKYAIPIIAIPIKNSDGNWKIWNTANPNKMIKATKAITKVTIFKVPLILCGAAKM